MNDKPKEVAQHAKLDDDIKDSLCADPEVQEIIDRLLTSNECLIKEDIEKHINELCKQQVELDKQRFEVNRTRVELSRRSQELSGQLIDNSNQRVALSKKSAMLKAQSENLYQQTREKIMKYLSNIPHAPNHNMSQS